MFARRRFMVRFPAVSRLRGRPGAQAGRALAHGVRYSSSTRHPRGDQYKAFMLDFTGVLHQYGTAVPGAREFIQYLMFEDIPYSIITNECRFTKAEMQAKMFEILGVSVPRGQIYTAGDSARCFFTRLVDRGWVGNVYVIGEAGLRESITEALEKGSGSQAVFGDSHQGIPCDFVCIGSVITGGANDKWTAAERASTFVRNGAKLVYSNPDWFDVTADGAYKFGCPMPVVKLLMRTTGCSAYNLGKPNPAMFRRAHEQLLDVALSLPPRAQSSPLRSDLDLHDVLFVGDTLDTDVRTAIENNIDAALVLSGTTTMDDLRRSALQPSYVFESIKGLHAALREGSLVPGGHRGL